MLLQENETIPQLGLSYKGTNIARNESEELAIIYIVITLTAKLWGLSLL